MREPWYHRVGYAISMTIAVLAFLVLILGGIGFLLMRLGVI